MVTTRSNIHDDGLAPNPANPEATIANLNERLAHMQKNVEDLTAHNAILQATCIPEVHVPNLEMHIHNPEQSHKPAIVPPIVNPEKREEYSHTST
jgi:hypothetical protein